MIIDNLQHTKKAQTEIEAWTEIISPTKSVFNINLQEFWQYRHLITLFVKRDIAAQYRQTILGVLWFLIQPLLTSFIFVILFNNIAGISTDGLPPVLFYLSGLIIWTYFSACLLSTSQTFIVNASIFGKVYFPRLCLPAATMLSNLFKFSIQLLLVIGLMVFLRARGDYSFSIGLHYLFLPIVILFMGLIGTGTGLIISAMTTKYRDLNLLLTFGISLLMYMSPVAYPLSFLEGSAYFNFIRFNPLSPLIEGFRYALFGVGGSLDVTSFVYCAVCCIILLAVGILLFNKTEKTFIDTV